MPFFFVVNGAQVDLGELSNVTALGTLGLITFLAVVGKVLGCSLGALSLGRKSALIVGIGMVPRGDVGIIVASLGRQAEVINQETYTLVILMVLLTSLIAPPLLAAMLSREYRKS